MLRQKAVVVGGSNGIGLAIVKKLIEKGYYVLVLDMVEPEEGILLNDNYEYYACNLLEFDEDLFIELSKDTSINLLMITAGFGRVASFEYLHCSEINNLFTVNACAGIKIIRCFYDRISSKDDFYVGMMGSIAGLMSSPLFSVYAATKSAICRFIESVNIELEQKETPNRILNISPASISGTRFSGDKNDLSKLESLAEEILNKMNMRIDMFIPQYEETFKAVLERYQTNPHEYGMHSYEYKMNSGRVNNHSCVKIGYLSGTFDLFHVGHLNLLRNAKKKCDYLIVGVHPSGAHKGKETFIPFEERQQIVGACKYVDKVVIAPREDSEAVFLYNANRLFVGSDYKGTERFNEYEKLFADKDIEIVYFPYTKSTSSTQIRSNILNSNNNC